MTMTFCYPNRSVITEPFSVVGIDDGFMISNSKFIGYYNHEKKLHRVNGPAFCHILDQEDYWFINGVIHREGGPALVRKDRTVWFKNGVIHREGGPAISDHWVDSWCQNGLLHREDGPAKVYKLHDTTEWYWYGRLHRTDGPARITKNVTEWYRRGHLHRTDGPAVIHKVGTMEWRYRGGYHRSDGPAYIDGNGNPGLWAYYGKRFTKLTDFLNHATITDTLKTELMLTYGV